MKPHACFILPLLLPTSSHAQEAQALPVQIGEIGVQAFQAPIAKAIVFSPVTIILLVWLLFAVAVFAVAFSYFSIWLRATSSGVPLSLVEIIGMRLRKVNPQAVVRALVMAKQAGVVISCADMTKAYLQGVDLEKVTLAMIEAKKKDIEITLQDLMDAELHDRLSEKLKM